jgi:hypothetical protein
MLQGSTKNSPQVLQGADSRQAEPALPQNAGVKRVYLNFYRMVV